MTPALFDLPLRLGDTVALAAVLIDVLGALPKPVTDNLRSRIAARIASIPFQSLRPFPASIERDPVHPSAHYICVDGVEDTPLLLRVAPSSTPSSGLFPKAILIGRTHLGTREVVLNAIPFGPADRDRIAPFSESVNRAFLPKSAGTRSVVRVRAEEPAQTAPHALESFRATHKSTGQNQSAFALSEGQNADEFYFAVVWSAIRSGWREGYALEGPRNDRRFEVQLNHVIRNAYLTGQDDPAQIARKIAGLAESS